MPVDEFFGSAERLDRFIRASVGHLCDPADTASVDLRRRLRDSYGDTPDTLRDLSVSLGRRRRDGPRPRRPNRRIRGLP